MSELHLDSLEIKNCRCFEHLTLEKLGRVNLIVGKNSVGKTALLEGLWLLTSGARWPIIHKILYDRNDLVIYNMPWQSSKSLQQDAIQSFFSGRPKLFPQSFEIALGDLVFNFAVIDIFGDNIEIRYMPNTIICKDNISTFPDLPQKDFLEYEVIEQSKKSKTVFIPLKGLTWQAVSTYWDDIALTDKEEEITTCLKLLDPLTTRFTSKGENMQDRVRYSVVKTGRFPDPVPLANLGEGIQRIFAMALAMSTASNGYLLIDEFETGLYHNVQADVWRAIFKLAHDWNIQVFATTHSWDCVEAFQEAAAEDENEEAMLIRLQHKRSGDGIEAVLYDEELLAKATRQQVEVR